MGVIKAWFMLYIGIGIQLLFVHQIYKLLNAFCPGGEADCPVESGWRRDGTSIMMEWYLCAADNRSNLRYICVLIFSIQMFRDARESFQLLVLLWKLPGRDGHWITFASEELEAMDMTY